MSRRFEKASITVSYALMILLLLALIFTAYWLDDIVNAMIDTVDHVGSRAEITEGGRLFVLVDAYSMIAIAALAVVLLFFLLRVVQKEQVFSASTPRLLNAISWCCFLEGLCCLLAVVYFQLAFGLAVAACFLGLCLRIVKHVIEKAITLKDENDYTI